jgi:hypothetical protein
VDFERDLKGKAPSINQGLSQSSDEAIIDYLSPQATTINNLFLFQILREP